MKNLLSLIVVLMLSITGLAQDLTFDSLAVPDPIRGARVRTVTASSVYNCASLIQLNVGQSYKLLMVTIGIQNAGSQKAFIGLPGVTPGVYNNPCMSAYQTIDGFVTHRIEDPCGNILANNENKAWTITNSSPITDAQRYCPYPSPATFVQTDSIELSPGWCSTEGWSSAGTWLDVTTLAAGDYYLILHGNFTPYEDATTCYPNTVTYPFTFDGGTGITFTATGAACNQSVPGSPTEVTASTSNGSQTARSGVVSVNWIAADNNATYFVITPYVVLSGNTEKAVTSQAKQSTSTSAIFVTSDLRTAQEINGVAGVDKNNLKFRFKVKAVNSSGESVEVSSGNPAVSIR